MSARPALLKPPPRPAEPPRARPEPQASGAWPARHGSLREAHGETHDDGDRFEQLLAGVDGPSPADIGQGTVADFSGGDRQPSGQDPERCAAAPLPAGPSAGLWQTLLARLEERLEALDAGPLEVQLHMPTLGTVSARIIQHGASLEIALGFAKDSARRYCDARRQASADWLGRQLGRSVRLTLHHEAH
ncbi:type III secretion system HrpP C-terminal domain-containing protein [Pseudomonas sp. COR58]|uniref:Type III secretion system HrpP C-terminal domain-containing protein n=1 Tax=Pseudomonas ekonensis TaxID=2842353 RepID=A0ABS6PDB7_9PSED|nr:type III secretion system HrpP C-terminal domain-containing protein [Pseudomonas ekonensis]MBV4458455.1 type III secretion system HrpP C-terminal domain-containing protein [Pseudomonas ekonensis]